MRSGAWLLQRRAAQGHFEESSPAGRQGDAVFRHIARLDANHLLEFLVAEVRHLLRFGDPRIPNNRGCRAGLVDSNFPTQLAILHFDCRRRIEENPVDFRSDSYRVARFVLLDKVIGFIEVGRAFEPADCDLANVADKEIAVEAILKLNV